MIGGLELLSDNLGMILPNVALLLFSLAGGVYKFSRTWTRGQRIVWLS